MLTLANGRSPSVMRSTSARPSRMTPAATVAKKPPTGGPCRAVDLDDPFAVREQKRRPA